MSASLLEEVLLPVAEAHGFPLSAPALERLSRYAALLLAWNERLNLTGARSLEVLARDHLADALAIVPQLPARGRCLDVGSGAGLPGVVLATARPDLGFVLLEPIQKRAAFLTAVARETGLSNFSVVRERLEDHARTHPRSYDFAVARAVFPLADWLARGPALVQSGGVVLGLAGADVSVSLPPGASTVPYRGPAGLRTLVRVVVS